MKEIWRTIKNWENYEVSNLGRVNSNNFNSNHKTPKILKQTLNNGYFTVKLCDSGKTKIVKVHRLVAEAFIPNPDNLTEVNHKDENKINNCVDNLEWCDRTYNNNYGTRNVRSAKSHQKVVIQKRKDGTIIGRYGNIGIPALLYNTHHIGECCLGKRKSTAGYIWEYEEEDNMANKRTTRLDEVVE